MVETKLEIATAGAKLGGGFVIFNLSPTEYAGLFTAAYFFVQTLYTLWKWNKERKS